jgi:phosphatidylglycerol lysyltransferase
MSASLPSSWLRNQGPCPRYDEVKLPISRHIWLPFADIPVSYDFFALYDDLKSSYPEGFVIRGCPPDVSNLFRELRHDTCRTGIDAILDLSDRSHFEGKKVLAALRRGWRHGRVEEVRLNTDNADLFQSLLSTSPHAGKPRLKHLFRNDLSKVSRCFVFRSFSGTWLACLTLSEQTKKVYRIELMLRSRQSPGDIMECLIAETAARLLADGADELSLGEVPFMLHEDDAEPMSALEQLIFAAAPFCRHAYDYQGLCFFKKKFRPTWRTMRLCAGPGVRFTPSFLIELAYSMGFLELLTQRTLLSLLAGGWNLITQIRDQKGDGDHTNNQTADFCLSPD